MSFRRALHFLIFSLALLASTTHAYGRSLPVRGRRAFTRAQPASATFHPEVSHLFGEQLSFFVRVEAGQPVASVHVRFQAAGALGTIVKEMTLDPETGEAFYVHDVMVEFVKAFSHIDYWFRVTLADGAELDSPEFAYFYDDNRFTWHTLDSPPFHVHWHEGDVSFAQAILDTAQLGLKEVQAMIPAPSPERVDIYAYAGGEEYRFARGQLGPQWAGGHADPALGLILVSLPAGPAQRLEIERKIPHEVAHISLFQATTDSGFTHLPQWLNEGIASNIELYPNPDYRYLLDNAQENDTLLPVNTLCGTFPVDASGALLAYAEAASFVSYLQQTYGNTGLQALVQQYASGIACENGPAIAPFQKSLTQLEYDWRRATFPKTSVNITVSPMLPWVVIFMAIMTGPFIMAVGARRRNTQTEDKI